MASSTWPRAMQLINQARTSGKIHGRQLNHAAQKLAGLVHFTAHAVGMGHNGELGDGIRNRAFLDEQLAHEGVQRQVGRRVLDGIEGLVHGGAQASGASQLVDAIDRTR